MYNKDDVIRAVAGMWPEAIQSISSVSSSTFNGKHQACPSCSGRDRFRYDDHYQNKADGGYICSQCGSGDGISLLMKVSGMSFGETVTALGDWVGGIPVERREVVRSQVIQKAQQEKYGSYSDHDKCAIFLATCASNPVAHIAISYGISPSAIYSCKGKSGVDLICVPVSLCSQLDMICDIAFIHPDDRPVAFLSKGFPAAGVSVIPGEGEYTYLCATWAEAWHTHHATGAEVWCCWSPTNISQVAFRMKGKKLRVSCHPSDKETIYAADESALDVIMPRDGRWSMGIERKLYKAGDLCAAL